MRSAHASVCGQCARSAAASAWPHRPCSACPRSLRRGRHQYGRAVRRCMCVLKRPQQRGKSGDATDSLPRPSLLPFHIRLIAQSLDKLPLHHLPFLLIFYLSPAPILNFSVFSCGFCFLNCFKCSQVNSLILYAYLGGVSPVFWIHA